MVDASSSPTCTVASPIAPSSRTSSATCARIRSASGRPSISVAVNALRDRQLDVADVEAERLREADADLDVLLQLLDVSRAHRGTDERALLWPPERVLDEGRQQPVGSVDERALRLRVRTVEQHLLVGHPGAVMNAVVGRQPVAEILEHRPARGAGDQPE